MGGAVKKIRKKMRNLNSLTVPKKGESLSVEKSGNGDPSAWEWLFFLILKALDALKMSTKYIW